MSATAHILACEVHPGSSTARLRARGGTLAPDPGLKADGAA
jgi:hypothetical protein